MHFHILFRLKGCYAALKDEITTYGNIFVGVGITILLIEVIYIPKTFWYICTFQSQFILSNFCVLQMLKKFVIDKYYFQLLAVVFAFVICCQTGDKNHAV